MPLRDSKDFGTNTDQSKNKEYCCYCFQHGKYIDFGITLKQKIEKNIQIAKNMGMSEDKARKMAEDILPKLKRWKK
jgi:hypothetical protein